MKLLSTVNDVHGHTVRRYTGDVIEVSRNGKPVDATTEASVRDWYWAHVGVKGNDPQRETPEYMTEPML